MRILFIVKVGLLNHDKVIFLGVDSVNEEVCLTVVGLVDIDLNYL